jgi:hypothetical protein
MQIAEALCNGVQQLKQTTHRGNELGLVLGCNDRKRRRHVGAERASIHRLVPDSIWRLQLSFHELVRVHGRVE